jgi:hypothetical protein
MGGRDETRGACFGSRRCADRMRRGAEPARDTGRFSMVLSADATTVGLACPEYEAPLVGPAGQMELWQRRSLTAGSVKKRYP